MFLKKKKIKIYLFAKIVLLLNQNDLDVVGLLSSLHFATTRVPRDHLWLLRAYHA